MQPQILLIFGLVVASQCAVFDYDADGVLEYAKASGILTEHELKQKERKIGFDSVITDPCLLHHCAHGKECVVDNEGNPACICVESCPEQTSDTDLVCSNQNVTFRSLCHLDQMRCWCRQHSDRCSDSHFTRSFLDYYGACREMQKCSEDELEDFPRRLREWFFLVMEEIVGRNLLPERLEAMVRAGRHKERNKILPAVWKFCEMDAQPRNNAVTRRELIPLISQIKATEHCTDQMIDKCDLNDDHLITLDEWAVCLRFTYDDVAEWIGKCDELVTVHELKHTYTIV